MVGVGDVPHEQGVLRPEDLGQVRQRLVPAGPLSHVAFGVAVIDHRPCGTAARAHDEGRRHDLDTGQLRLVRHLPDVFEVELPPDLAHHKRRVGRRSGVWAGAPWGRAARSRDLHPVGHGFQHPAARPKLAPLGQRPPHSVSLAVPKGHFDRPGGRSARGTRRQWSRLWRRLDRGDHGGHRRGRRRPRRRPAVGKGGRGRAIRPLALAARHWGRGYCRGAPRAARLGAAAPASRASPPPPPELRGSRRPSASPPPPLLPPQPTPQLSPRRAPPPPVTASRGGTRKPREAAPIFAEA